MNVKVVDQIVNEGERVLYGEQHQSVKSDLRTELLSLGSPLEVAEPFVRMELREVGLVLTVGRAVAGRGADYRAIWVLLPREGLGSALGMVEWYASEMLKALDRPQGNDEILQRMEEYPLDEYGGRLYYSLSRRGGGVGRLYYDSEDHLHELLKTPLHQQYRDYAAIYLLARASGSAPSAGDLSEGGLHPPVTISPPEAERMRMGGVKSLSIEIDGQKHPLTEPCSVPYGQHVTLRWEHARSLYELHTASAICIEDKQLEAPDDRSWKWKFDVKKFIVFDNEGNRLSLYRMRVNEKEPAQYYTRSEIMRGLSIVIEHEDCQSGDRELKEDELERGAIKFSLRRKPKPAPKPAYRQPHSQHQVQGFPRRGLNVWKVLTFAMGLLLLLSWGGGGVFYSQRCALLQDSVAGLKKDLDSLRLKNESSVKKTDKYEHPILVHSLLDALNLSVWTKGSLDGFAPGIYNAIQCNNFQKIMELLSGNESIRNHNGPLVSSFKECFKYKEHVNGQSLKIWGDSIHKWEYVNYLNAIKVESKRRKENEQSQRASAQNSKDDSDAARSE